MASRTGVGAGAGDIATTGTFTPSLLVQFCLHVNAHSRTPWPNNTGICVKKKKKKKKKKRKRKKKKREHTVYEDVRYRVV